MIVHLKTRSRRSTTHSKSTVSLERYLSHVPICSKVACRLMNAADPPKAFKGADSCNIKLKSLRLDWRPEVALSDGMIYAAVLGTKEVLLRSEATKKGLVRLAF